jgi:hypothetical protein
MFAIRLRERMGRIDTSEALNAAAVKLTLHRTSDSEIEAE